MPGRVLLGLSIHDAVGSWGGVGRWLAALTVSLDVTIVNVARPTLVRQLGTTTDLRWVVDTDNLAFAALVLVSGSLSGPAGPQGHAAGRPARWTRVPRRPALALLTHVMSPARSGVAGVLGQRRNLT